MEKLIEKTAITVMVIFLLFLGFDYGCFFTNRKQAESKPVTLTNPATYQTGDTLRISPLNAGQMITVTVGE